MTAKRTSTVPLNTKSQEHNDVYIEPRQCIFRVDCLAKVGAEIRSWKDITDGDKSLCKLLRADGMANDALFRISLHNAVVARGFRGITFTQTHRRPKPMPRAQDGAARGCRIPFHSPTRSEHQKTAQPERRIAELRQYARCQSCTI